MTFLHILPNFNPLRTLEVILFEGVWSADWSGRVIFSHGTSHSKGVYMLLNPTSNLQISFIENDSSGRYIIMKITIEGTDYFLINVRSNGHSRTRKFYAIVECEPNFEN